jgi:hypothetical protein
MERLKIREAAKLAGTAMKEKDPIVEKWPYRLKLKPGQPGGGGQQEFDRLLGGECLVRSVIENGKGLSRPFIWSCCVRRQEIQW